MKCTAGPHPKNAYPHGLLPGGRGRAPQETLFAGACCRTPHEGPDMDLMQLTARNPVPLAAPHRTITVLDFLASSTPMVGQGTPRPLDYGGKIQYSLR